MTGASSFRLLGSVGVLIAAFWGSNPMVATASEPIVEVVADLVTSFAPANAKDCSECGVRPSASAGGEHRAAIFEHPATPQRPAQITYEVALPKLLQDELLLFAFWVGIADGAKLDTGADGVRFSVEVAGTRMFSEVWKQNRWREIAIDLTPFAGRRVQLVLLADAISNTSYDWAVWGAPRVLRFNPASLAAGTRLRSGAGGIAVNLKSDQESTIRLKPVGSGQPIERRIPRDANSKVSSRWHVVDFSFTAAEAVDVEIEPVALFNSDQLRVGGYPAAPRLLRLTPLQAVTLVGQTTGVRVEVKNEGKGRLEAGVATLRLYVGTNAAATSASLNQFEVPALSPGESWTRRCEWSAPSTPEMFNVKAVLSIPGAPEMAGTHTAQINVQASTPGPVVESGALRMQFFNLGTDAAQARFLAADRSPVAVWSPLMRIVVESAQGPVEWNVPLGGVESERAGVWSLRSQDARDPAGGIWDALLRLRVEPGTSRLRIHSELTPRKDSSIRTFWGPNLYVGDRGAGESKQWGLFPGLEYLFGSERSSNPRDFAPPLADRRTPQPQKYTIPLMAIMAGTQAVDVWERRDRFYTPDSQKDSVGSGNPSRPSVVSDQRSEPMVSLWWDPLQKWDGRHEFPSPRFASPNFDEGMENHRMGLFVPSVPDFVAENVSQSGKPFVVRAGESLKLECTVLMTESRSILSAIQEWLDDRGGLPVPNPWPRSFQEELNICRAGFLKTVWDEKNEKWRHCIDWGAGHSPGFAALLWMDSKAATDPEAQRLSRQRVDLALTNMWREGGAASFASQANCHIMQWELPFLYGYLPEAMAGMDDLARSLIQSQRPDGGWIYEPSNKEQSELGQAGDSVLGTCANRASTILRYARITGDTNALTAGIRALEFMEQFRVPRGGQTWECPMYEPDILAAAYAIKGYLDGYRATGDRRWLHDAVYWAETGVPFIYLWSLPDKPMMLGATIPVFGSTFYTHSWLATPVQWCGLVYAYHVLHLAEELDRAAVGGSSKGLSPLPLGLKFTPLDWRRIVELITVSGIYQQFADGPRIGTYPDSISQFEKRNPAFINPEDILINVLSLKGFDPDIETARASLGDAQFVVSSGAHIGKLDVAPQNVKFQLRFFKGEPSHTLVSGFKPSAVLVNGDRLPESKQPVRREPGWWWDGKHGRLYLTASHAEVESIQVELIR